MKAIIIEDEKMVQDQLRNALHAIDPSIEINSVISSVKDGVEILSDNQEADIIFSDIQLSDGLSFEIFSATKLKIPVIFITGFDSFLTNAFEYNGIDYLLKPIDKSDLQKALIKYKTLELHFKEHNTLAVEKLSESFSGKRKNRIVVHKGIENVSLKLEDIVLFYTESKIVYVLDKCGKKFLYDKNLTDLENELDKNMFFRANRQYLVNIEYIKSYKSYERVKLLVDLSIDNLNHCIIISQETAPVFRKWIMEN